jgi:hypothetical protein
MVKRRGVEVNGRTPRHENEKTSINVLAAADHGTQEDTPLSKIDPLLSQVQLYIQKLESNKESK